MSSPLRPESQQVYLAYRSIFTGANALLRKKKVIQKVLEAREHSNLPMIPGYDIDKLSTVLKSLLERGIFQNENAARAAFPSLFIAPEEESEHASVLASEGGEEENEQGEYEVEERKEDWQGKESVRMGSQGHDSSATEESVSPVFYPVSLPYHAQHSIHTQVQQCLEQCCFDFAARWLPSHLAERGWDCAVAVELTKWVRLLPQWLADLPIDGHQVDIQELRETSRDVCHLRHISVHRQPVTAGRTVELLRSATRMAQALRDTLRVAQLETLQATLETTIRAMELEKATLEQQFLDRLRDIQRRRAELEKEENELRVGVVQGDRENTGLAGRSIEQSIERIFTEDIEIENGWDEPSGYTTADEGGGISIKCNS